MRRLAGVANSSFGAFSKVYFQSLGRSKYCEESRFRSFDKLRMTKRM